MIENTGPSDAGTYAVTANNAAGSVTSSAKLEVAGNFFFKLLFKRCENSSELDMYYKL